MLHDHFRKTFASQEDPFDKVIGQNQAKHDLKSALLAGRNVIFIGQPGIGKTTLAKTISDLMPEVDGQKAPFVRVQGSPDLSAEDLLGDLDPIKALEFGPTSKEAFTPGKIFQADGGVLFFDEINRCPAKLQNALLQVLEENHATIGSYTIDFPANVIFVGTMNPQDQSTEQLSNVFLDRFDLIYMHHPETVDEEMQILATKSVLPGVTIDEGVTRFIVEFMHKMRRSDHLVQPPSVRATIGLYERAAANALLANRTKVSYKDVFSAVMSVLVHRIELKPSVKYVQSPTQYIKEQLKQFAEAMKVDQELDESDVP